MYTLSLPVGEQFLTVQKDEHYGGIIPIVVEDQIQIQIQIQVSIEPDVGEGLFYTTSIGLPSSDLQETSEHGGGVVTHLPEETYTLLSEPLPNNCSPLLGWGESATLRIPVVSNFVSFARIEYIADE
jgi:hypothetical protein